MISDIFGHVRLFCSVVPPSLWKSFFKKKRFCFSQFTETRPDEYSQEKKKSRCYLSVVISSEEPMLQDAV